ncbi:heparinase II/III domain-containing protein [Dyadobacter luticola]|nr:heparinase II/III family protein [Dyadobacter luticola]
MRFFAALIFVLTTTLAQAQVREMDTVQLVNPKTVIPDHPRLLLLKGEEKLLQKSINSKRIWKQVHSSILHQCDSLIATKPVERVLLGVRLLAKSRECLYRVFYLSYAWRMTHEEKYLKRAEQELLAVSNFSDWNPSHYLDVAEMTMAAAIGYDWLYDDLSEKSRTIIREAILKKGVGTSYDSAYPNYRKWLSVTNNWNQVCNAGISFGALATWESDPELARRVINRSVASIDIAMKDYDPDGAFAEGYTYWGYGTTFNIMFLSAIEKVFKTDFGLGKSAGFLKTACYLENMIGPTGKNFNYSDASESGILQPAMLWFGNKLKDPSLLWNERLQLTDLRIKLNADRLLPAILIWGKDVDPEKVEAPKKLLWTGAGRNPVALMRSSWTDPNAIFVGIKGGSPKVTHGHMDVGSFVLEADGIRWGKDFGAQDYTPLELRNIDLWADRQDGQRWEIFRYNNFAHNTLTVNNQLQQVTGKGVITSTTSDPAFLSAVADISTVYKGQVAKAERGAAIVDKKYVLIKDEIETSDAEVMVRWKMLTSALVKVSGNQAELIQWGKRLRIIVPEPANIVMQTWSTEPPKDYDEPNPGTTLVGFEVKIPAHSKSTFNVFLVPGGTLPDTLTTPKPLKDWH